MLELSNTLMEGPGATVLLLHGFLGSAQQWQPIVNDLKGKHQLLLIELPGHGKSPDPNPYNLSDVASAIHQILQDLNIARVHFVGHSMGGYVGCAFAKAYPQQLLSLHLINSCAAADTDLRKSQRDRSIQLVSKYPKAFISMAVSNLFTPAEKELFEAKIDLIKSQAQKISNASIIYALMAMRDRDDYLDELRQSHFPITYIYCNADEIIPSDLVQIELKLLKTNSFQIHSGHMSIITHPNEILDKMHLIE
ncbi:alpha/beta fold hydrolase [Nonlabens marinus]|uniref:Alpha/beta hydrolase fold n=1 Tax=Nonlabens marinus S1-08 TaxID=1454201 RepID=W8VPB4_9FLAO|nr:alpha/beta hydrolase [Nonlabens marinus]BAO54954.1 alpha/beta hydrolase fold [Nonlabens marinus S1-08]